MNPADILSPEARADLDSAFDYYDATDPNLSGDFAARAAEAFARVVAHPRIGREVHPGVRRVLVRNFPTP